ncbi:MAG: hypothetical protein COA50_07415 [Flavobacteriaceae bacterium]|nr:MAG: hypothetical protein COA50_07415 [Flavobacteriaceae bacterium]
MNKKNIHFILLGNLESMQEFVVSIFPNQDITYKKNENNVSVSTLLKKVVYQKKILIIDLINIVDSIECCRDLSELLENSNTVIVGVYSSEFQISPFFETFMEYENFYLLDENDSRYIILKCFKNAYHSLSEEVEGVMKTSKKTPIFSKKKTIHLLSSDQVVYIKKNNRHSIVYKYGKDKCIESIKAIDFYDSACGGNFFRTHNNYVINIDMVENIIKKDGDYCLMKNGDTVPISQKSLNLFLKTVNAL